VGWFRAATRFAQMFGALDLISEKLAAGAMVVALVLRCKQQLGPTHVEVVPATAIRAEHRNLCGRSGVSVLNQQQSQPRFLRRFGAHIDERERFIELP
jgi:hypothetical protein